MDEKNNYKCSIIGCCIFVILLSVKLIDFLVNGYYKIFPITSILIFLADAVGVYFIISISIKLYHLKNKNKNKRFK